MRQRDRAQTEAGRGSRRSTWPAVGILALLTGAAPAPAPAQWDGGAIDEQATAAPEGATYARIRYQQGAVTLLQDRTLVDTDVSVNAPLTPGDVLETGGDGRIELQLADGSLLWFDTSTRLSVQALSDGASRFENRTLLSLEGGSILVQVEPFDAEGKLFRVDTDAATVFLLEAGLYRLDVRRDGALRVTSRRGVAEVLARDESSLVRSGETTFVFPGGAPDAPVPANVRDGDEFDAWVGDRQDRYRVAVESTSYAAYADEIPVEVEPYLVEMESYGSWRRHPDYGPVWVPVVATGWQPYYYGRWSYRPVGWVWVSSDPWGYAPYHYGRWEYISGWGWSWMPGALYAPAWVSWGYTSAYVGWCPVGWYNYPSGWSLSIRFGGYHYPYWTYVDHHQFHHRYVDKVAVKDQAIADDVVRSPHPPRVSMDDVRARREDAAFARARNEAQAASSGADARGVERASLRSFRESERAAMDTVRSSGNSSGTIRGRQRSTAAAPAPSGRDEQVGSGSRDGRTTPGRALPQRAAPERTVTQREPSRGATPQGAAPRSAAPRSEPGRMPAGRIVRGGTPSTTRQVPASEPRRILTDTRTRRSPAPSRIEGRADSGTSSAGAQRGTSSGRGSGTVERRPDSGRSEQRPPAAGDSRSGSSTRGGSSARGSSSGRDSRPPAAAPRPSTGPRPSESRSPRASERPPAAPAPTGSSASRPTPSPSRGAASGGRSAGSGRSGSGDGKDRSGGGRRR